MGDVLVLSGAPPLRFRPRRCPPPGVAGRARHRAAGLSSIASGAGA